MCGPLPAVGEGAYSTGIWSLRWAGDSTEIVAGTADNSLYLFDVAQVGGRVGMEGCLGVCQGRWG